MLTCLCCLSSSIIGCVCQCVLCFTMYYVFLIRWYVDRCFFHCICIFLGKKLLCCDVRFVSVGIGGALQVFVFCVTFFVLVVLVLYIILAIF